LADSGWQNAISSIRVQTGTWDFFIDDNYVPPPNRGMADILDEARAAIARRCKEIKRGK
jgi:hypothetical protein